MGLKIFEHTMCPQSVQFDATVHTLNDAQKLLGTINWLRPYLGLSTAQLSPLFNILAGDSDLNSPRQITPEAQQALDKVQQTISNHHVYRVDPDIDIVVFVVIPEFHPMGIIAQWSDHWSPEPLQILEWMFLPHKPRKRVATIFELIAQLIIKCRHRCLQITAQDPAKFPIPIQRDYSEWSLANSSALQSALQSYTGQIDYHFPRHRLLQSLNTTPLSAKPKLSHTPVDGPPVFTDGSGKAGTAIVTWRNEDRWQTLQGQGTGSTQLVELKAVSMAFHHFNEPFNLIVDSACVADIVQ